MIDNLPPGKTRNFQLALEMRMIGVYDAYDAYMVYVSI